MGATLTELYQPFTEMSRRKGFAGKRVVAFRRVFLFLAGGGSEVEPFPSSEHRHLGRMKAVTQAVDLQRFLLFYRVEFPEFSSVGTVNVLPSRSIANLYPEPHSFEGNKCPSICQEKTKISGKCLSICLLELSRMGILEELKEEFEAVLEELGIREEELERCSSIALSRAKRKRGGKVYEWLILTGKVRENGRVKTKLIRNFYGKGKEEKLKRLVRLYRAIKVLDDYK